MTRQSFHQTFECRESYFCSTPHKNYDSQAPCLTSTAHPRESASCQRRRDPFGVVCSILFASRPGSPAKVCVTIDVLEEPSSLLLHPPAWNVQTFSCRIRLVCAAPASSLLLGVTHVGRRNGSACNIFSLLLLLPLLLLHSGETILERMLLLT